MADSVPIDRNHSELVKFAEGDSDYGCILQFLQSIATSTPIVSSRPNQEPVQRSHFSFVSDIGTREARASG
jgi:hypothetical protein